MLAEGEPRGGSTGWLPRSKHLRGAGLSRRLPAPPQGLEGLEFLHGLEGLE